MIRRHLFKIVALLLVLLLWLCVVSMGSGRYTATARAMRPVATNNVVTLNDTTFTTVLPANNNRSGVILSAWGTDIFVALCPATGATPGVLLKNRTIVMSGMVMYTGEVCAKSAIGETDIYVVEY